MLKLFSFPGESWSRLLRCIPSVSSHWRAQHTDLSTEHAGERRKEPTRRGGAFPATRSLEGTWNKFGVQKVYKKMSQLLDGESVVCVQRFFLVEMSSGCILV